MDASALDDFDRGILRLMQVDAGLTASEIGERIGLSASPTSRRIARLRTDGTIRATVALLDRRRIGLDAQVFAQVKLSAHGRAHLEEFTRAIASFPEVMECFVLMGPVDFLLRIVTSDVEAYERFFFERLSRVPGVQEINSTVALSEIKSTTALPLRQR